LFGSGCGAPSDQRPALEPTIRAVALRRAFIDVRSERPPERHWHRFGHTLRRYRLECDTDSRAIQDRPPGELRVLQTGIVLLVRRRAGGHLAIHRKSRPNDWRLRGDAAVFMF